MKSTTDIEKRMTDYELKSNGLRLRRSIPKDQVLFDAIKREVARRLVKLIKPNGQPISPLLDTRPPIIWLCEKADDIALRGFKHE